MKRLLLTAVLTVLMIAEVHAESFTISDIRVNGLQRVSAGSLFGALPLNVGDQVDERRLGEATRSLFKTGFFQDIQLGREGNVLVITVVERPSVASIEIEGNKAISTEDLMKGLKQSGLAEGEIFQLMARGVVIDAEQCHSSLPMHIHQREQSLAVFFDAALESGGGQIQGWLLPCTIAGFGDLKVHIGN